MGSGSGPPPPPGANAGGGGEPSMQEVLKSIQTQLTLQTAQMGRLAVKDDLKFLANKVEGIDAAVAVNSMDISSMKAVQDEDRSVLSAKIADLEQKVQELSEREAPTSVYQPSFSKDKFKMEKYALSRRSLRLWPVSIPALDGADPSEIFLRLRAAVYLFLTDFLKVNKPEDIEIEDLIVQRPMRRGNVKDEILVRFASVSERDEVIGHAANLKDATVPAGVRLDIPAHLQSDFKILIQYGNEARAHFGDEVKRSVRFFEQEYSLVLNLCLPSSCQVATHRP